MQPFECRSVRYWSKEINGTLTGGRKRNFFNSRPRAPYGLSVLQAARPLALLPDTGRGTSTATTARGTRPFSRPRAARTSGPRFDASTRSSRRSRPARGASPSRRHAHLVLPSCDSAARRGGSETNKFKNKQSLTPTTTTCAPGCVSRACSACAGRLATHRQAPRTSRQPWRCRAR